MQSSAEPPSLTLRVTSVISVASCKMLFFFGRGTGG